MKRSLFSDAVGPDLLLSVLSKEQYINRDQSSRLALEGA